MTSSQDRTRVDVLVIGGGSAGFSAAVACRQAGAEHVVILEKGPEEHVGGNARFSHTGYRFAHAGLPEIAELAGSEVDEQKMRCDPYSVEEFEEDLYRVTDGRIDSAIAKLIAARSNDAVRWMVGMGFEWSLNGGVVIDGVRHFDRGTILYPRGGGIGQMEKWTSLADAHGIDVRFNSAVRALHGSDAAVEGALVSGPDGLYDLSAANVILCSGGFQASAEKRAAYLGRNADLMKVRGSRYNTGEVLEMAIRLGAASAGQWQGAHATPVDRSAPDREVGSGGNRYSYEYGIMVNDRCERFFDEGEAEHTYTYAKTGWKVLDQAGGVAHQIFDQKSKDLLNKRYANARFVTADSIASLAGQLALDPALLSRTIDEFNAAIMDEVPFDPTRRDGRRTQGLAIDKTNWATRIDEPPYFAVTVTGGITFSFGGVKVDSDARVMNTSERAIDGLYASGDIVGLFYHNYPSCSGQTRNIVLSHSAAKGCSNVDRQGPRQGI